MQQYKIFTCGGFVLVVAIGASLCSNIRYLLVGVCFGGGYWCIIVQQYKIFTCGGFVLVVVIGAAI